MPAKPKAGLGKGLGSLIPTDFDPSLLMDSNDRIQNLFISDIEPNPDQPRRHFDADGRRARPAPEPSGQFCHRSLACCCRS